ncbi:hypothetical protein AQZ49_04765 [Novosphingobium sp. FSW06-99]|nr:hypothetical protein AQZ49_04765 [Novosphingobium sp. FSW06-99]
MCLRSVPRAARFGIGVFWGYFPGAPQKGDTPTRQYPMPLKDLEIKNAKPAERAYKLFDGGGMYLLVQPTGKKLWRMKYHHQGKERLLSFGAYPDISIAAAREKRSQAKLALADGIDLRDGGGLAHRDGHRWLR